MGILCRHLDFIIFVGVVGLIVGHDVSALASKDFCQVVRSPTHMSGSCIDHIYVLKDTVCDTRVIPVPYSQHAAIQIKIKM